jgi:hypothetical protein
MLAGQFQTEVGSMVTGVQSMTIAWRTAIVKMDIVCLDLTRVKLAL